MKECEEQYDSCEKSVFIVQYSVIPDRLQNWTKLPLLWDKSNVGVRDKAPNQGRGYDNVLLNQGYPGVFCGRMCQNIVPEFLS
jgi:hypothetical protein